MATESQISDVESLDRPLNKKESLKLWLSSPSVHEAERNLLSLLPFYPEAEPKRSASINKVDIGNKLYINEFEIVNSEQADQKEDLVMLHGYGAASPFYLKSFDAMSSVPGRTVHSLDMLGFGTSSRPKFHIPTKDITEKDEHGNFKGVIETENWFIDAIEKWRQARGIESFHLLGHSFGGYLSLAYAGKYPSHVKSLVLVSPAGIDRGYTPELEQRSPFKKKLSRNVDVVDPLLEEAELQKTISRQSGFSAQSSSETIKKVSKIPEMPPLILALWNRNWSVFDIVNKFLFIEYFLLSKWTFRRFKNFSLEEKRLIDVYSAKMFPQRVSGDRGVTRILAPGALARMPWVDRVEGSIKCPTFWMYGDKDWMNADAGKEASRTLRKQGLRSEHTIIKDAGHMIFLDNHLDFDKAVNRFWQRLNL